MFIVNIVALHDLARVGIDLSATDPSPIYLRTKRWRRVSRTKNTNCIRI